MADFNSLVLYASLFISLFFEVFLLITYLEVRSDIKSEEEMLKRDLSHFPSVTIVVPSFNEAETVGATISSLLALDYPKDKLHLILVDDGSTDETLKTLKTFEGNSQIKVFTKPNGGKHTAVNLALKHVETELVGCLDADSFVTAEALKRIVPYFNNPTVMAVTPSIKVFEPKNILQYIQKTEYSWSIFLRRMLSSMSM
jgi:peptidoglycan-N-acetylglucosamine deacetylase